MFPMCTTGEGDKVAKRLDRENSKNLRKWYKDEQEIIKLLLLGG